MNPLNSLILLSVVGFGCTTNNPLQGPTDLGAADSASTGDLATGADLGPSDLAGTDIGFGRLDFSGVDFGGFCAGTAVAGTCVQTFFAPVAACFMPAGACHLLSPTVSKTMTYCWMDGATFRSVTMLESSTRSWLNGASECLVESLTQLAMVGPMFSDGTSTMELNPVTGAYKCANGSTGTIGANLGGCAALDALLNPVTASCTAGACPP